MKLIIGVGSVGFEALLYFEGNFSNIPDCALLLSDKEFEDRAVSARSLRFPPDLQKWNNIKLGI